LANSALSSRDGVLVHDYPGESENQKFSGGGVCKELSPEGGAMGDFGTLLKEGDEDLPGERTR